MKPINEYVETFHKRLSQHNPGPEIPQWFWKWPDPVFQQYLHQDSLHLRFLSQLCFPLHSVILSRRLHWMAKVPMGNSRLLSPLVIATVRDLFPPWCPYQLPQMNSDSSCRGLLLTSVPTAELMKINILTGQPELQTVPCLPESMV